MTSFSPSPDRRPSPADRLAALIGVARELALNGSGGPARSVCGSVFLDHVPLLMRDGALLGAYVECLLLLKMTALLPRLVQAIYGVTFDMVPMIDRLAGPGVERWLLNFGNGVRLSMTMPGPRAEQGVREHSAAHWRAVILAMAALEPTADPAVGAPMAAMLETAS